jgi:hypothetical protein
MLRGRKSGHQDPKNPSRTTNNDTRTWSTKAQTISIQTSSQTHPKIGTAKASPIEGIPKTKREKEIASHPITIKTQPRASTPKAPMGITQKTIVVIWTNPLRGAIRTSTGPSPIKIFSMRRIPKVMKEGIKVMKEGIKVMKEGIKIMKEGIKIMKEGITQIKTGGIKRICSALLW